MIIDRFEGEFAVIELSNGEHENLPLKLLPKGASEGDVLLFSDGIYLIDIEKTRQLREEISLLQDELFDRS